MIILEGCDSSGKSTFARMLAAKSGKHIYHFTKESNYLDYLEPLTSLTFSDAILDRCFFSEPVYAKVMERTNQFTPTQYRNLIHTTLAQRPEVVLFTSRSPDYDPAQYLPIEKWNACLWEYRIHFGHELQIPYHSFDSFAENTDLFLAIVTVLTREADILGTNKWYHDLHALGCAPGGQTLTPDLLIVCERLGPSNVHNIVFEAGPTATLMDELIAHIKIPLGRLCITNIVKDIRGATRKVKTQDLAWFETEIASITPKSIIFMGNDSKMGIPIAKQFNTPYDTIEHLGYLHRKLKGGDQGKEQKLDYFNRFGNTHKKLMGLEVDIQSQMVTKVVRKE